MAENRNQMRHDVTRRLLGGLGYGALATVAMSAVMLAGVATGIAPMPKPVPAALVAHTFGVPPGPVLIVLAAAAHLGYGATAGAALTATFRRPAVWHALALAVLLWAVMGLVWLPYLGWGLFGTAITVKIALATLMLHLVYGLTLGLLLASQTRRHAAQLHRDSALR
jgi:hypothetical protein